MKSRENGPGLRVLATVGLLLAGAGCADGGVEDATPPLSQPDGSMVIGANPDAGPFVPGGSSNPVPSNPGMSAPSGDGGQSSRADASASDGSVAPRPDGGNSNPGQPPLPSGKAYGTWTWVDVPGAVCRDGSPAGYYWRLGKSENLVIFMNGGGACSDPFFCSLNPVNVNQDLPTQSLIDATGNLLIGPDPNRQVPPDEGLFKRDMRNPVADWGMVYIPYCTGDVFAGNKPDAMVPGVDGKQQFVGYKNVGLMLDSFGPSFAGAEKVLLSGSSAGGFATLINYDRVQTFFDKYGARVIGVTDSGIPFREPHLSTCLQKRWRDTWNLSDALPKDCKGCFRADGGGLTEGLGTYMFKEKYKDRVLGGMISAAEDGVIRAFFGAGLDDCNADPGLNTIASALNFGGFSGEAYRAGLKDVLDFVGRDKVGSYMLDSWEHMHLWRARFYEVNGNGRTIAEWLGDIIDGKPTHLGTL